jgi:hypothetical protein
MLLTRRMIEAMQQATWIKNSARWGRYRQH